MLIRPDHKYLQYSGRIDDTDPYAYLFIYPATLVNIRFRGTAICACLENHRQYWNNYMGVILDGMQSVLCLSSGEEPDTVYDPDAGPAEPGSLLADVSGATGADVRNVSSRPFASRQIDVPGEATADVRRYVLAENLEDTEHSLMLFKRQDSCHMVLFRGFELPEGSEILKPFPKPERRMEVYGDSVSAGEVSEAVAYTGMTDPPHNGEYSNAWYSYAWQTARRLNAELHDIAQGGIALLDGTGYFNAPDLIGMEHVWDKLQYNPAIGEVTDWNFTRYTPHVVIVAIGQNDSYPEDIMKDDPEGEKAVAWKRHYKKLIEGIRGKYPQTLIVLATTILAHDRGWDDAIGEVCEAIGDDRTVHFRYKRNGCGTPGHVRIGEAEEMAAELAAFIEDQAERCGCFQQGTAVL